MSEYYQGKNISANKVDAKRLSHITEKLKQLYTDGKLPEFNSATFERLIEAVLNAIRIRETAWINSENGRTLASTNLYKLASVPLSQISTFEDASSYSQLPYFIVPTRNLV